jgi:thiol-disulfide isomerase/thioredoxin
MRNIKSSVEKSSSNSPIMSRQFKEKRLFLIIITILELTLVSSISAQTHDNEIIIHLLRVYESNISLFSQSGTKIPKSITEVKDVKKGEMVHLDVPKDYLPGDFLLRFSYKKENGSSSSSSEMNIIMSNQSLELWVNPRYCNNPDSTWFQKGERENSTFMQFTKGNNRKKAKLGQLQKFLMSYDDTTSLFYRQGIDEYEQRRQAYNQWLDSCINKDRQLFVSHTYRFQYIPQIDLHSTGEDRIFGMLHHYFDGIDFNDSTIIKTIQFNEWMDHYVNICAKMAPTPALRDSLIPIAARNAIDKAKQGHPLVYGGMVDYFYKGFETNNIPNGMKVLQPYLNDPNCLTSKKMEIERRIKGMETLVKGSKAPDILLKDADSSMFELINYKPSSKYILILFWSAECSHCAETINALYPWQHQQEINKKMSVVAISVDETETEIKTWNQKIKDLIGWKHMRAKDGIRSKVASDYFVLATPVMILLDAKTKEIVSIPSTFSQLKNDLL